jgi:myosin heavy subunit
VLFAVPSPSSNIIPVSPIVPAQSLATQEEVALLRMQLLEYEKKLAETESNSHKLSQLESELANMSKIISESSYKKSSHQNNNDANEQDIVQGNMLFKQTQSAQSKTVNGEQGSGKNLSSTELQNKIDRIESQIANLERGVIKVEERVDGIDTRVEELESINERLRSVSLLVLSYLIFYISFYSVCFPRLNLKTISALKKLGVENTDDLKYVYSSQKQMKKLEEQLSPIDYDRFEEAKASLFAKSP